MDNAKLPIHTTKRADVAYLIEMKRINTKLLRKIFWRINNMQTDRQNNQCSKKTKDILRHTRVCHLRCLLLLSVYGGAK